MEFIKSLIPSENGTILGLGVALGGTMLDRLFGGFDIVFEFLIVIMIIDYLTGVLAAYINPNEQLSSAKGWL